jgi:hypothetical protein
MEEQLDFNLSFEEGYFKEEPRRCKCERRVMLAEHRIPGMLVSVSPPYSGDKYCLDAPEIAFVLLAPRSGSDSLFPVSEWPMRVYVYFPLIACPMARESISSDELTGVGIGTLYLDGKDAWKAVAKKR